MHCMMLLQFVNIILKWVNNMSKMSEMYIEIAEMLENGYDADDISVILDVPIDWVQTVAKNTESTACQDNQPTL